MSKLSFAIPGAPGTRSDGTAQSLSYSSPFIFLSSFHSWRWAGHSVMEKSGHQRGCSQTCAGPVPCLPPHPVFYRHAHPCLYSPCIYPMSAPTSKAYPSILSCLSLASEIESTHVCFLVASGGLRELSGGVCGLWGLGSHTLLAVP